MPLVGECGHVQRAIWRAAGAGLLAVGSVGGVGAQDSSGELGTSEGVATVVEARPEAAATLEEGHDAGILFADGPRVSGVLSAEGTLIETGVKKPEPREEGGAVAGLVSSLTGEAQAPESSGGEDSELAEEPRGRSRNLLQTLGGLLGLGGD